MKLKHKTNKSSFCKSRSCTMGCKTVEWDERYIFRLAPDLLLFSYLLYSPFDSILEMYPVACVDDSGLGLHMLQN